LSTSAANPAECCQQCGQRPNCLGFTFREIFDQTCFFETVSTSFKVSLPGFVSAECRAPPPPPTKECLPNGFCLVVSVTDDLEAATQAAKMADTALVFLATTSGEVRIKRQKKK
jgi:hypothetical protein